MLRKFFLNGFLNIALIRLISRIIPLFMSGYIIHCIGIFEFGRLGFAKSIAFYFTTIIQYGFNYIGAKQILQQYYNNKDINKTVSSIIYAQLLMTIICVIIGIVLVTIVPQIHSVWYELFLYSCVSVLSAIFPTYIFHGLNMLHHVTYINLGCKILQCCIIPFVLHSADDISKYILLIVGIDGVRMIIAMVILRKLSNIRLVFCDFKSIISQYKEGFTMFVYQCYSTFIIRFPYTYLGFTLSHQAVGIYSVVSQLGRYINDLYDACIQGLYPVVHISKSEFKATINILKIAIPIAVLISIIVYIFTPYIVSYLGLGGNEIAIEMVHIYLCVLPLQFLNNILGTSILNKNYIPIIILGGVTIVVANYFLVNLCGVIGTMWAFAIQTLINFLLICLFFWEMPSKY